METIQENRYFGDYLIKRRVGIGGMATVYLAIHSQSEQELALKILHEHFAADSQTRKRLEAEAHIVMALDHPNIVPVWDFGEVDKRPYLVMPYMEGGSMAQYFAKPRLVKHETSLQLLAILADALDYAHSQQVIHRDFKLENILVNKSVPAISDFGIAQSANTTRITMTGQVLGTPQYLAPEALDDTPIDFHADLYAMAVTAYLLLTGYFPFTGKDAISIAVKLSTEDAPNPSDINPKLPQQLDEILLRGLAKDPQARFASAKEFVATLEDAFSELEPASTATMIYANELNPIKSTQRVKRHLRNAARSHPSTIATHDFRGKSETIAAPQQLRTMASAKSSRRPLTALLLLFACTLVGFAFFALSGGTNLPQSFLNLPETTATDAETSLLVEPSEASSTPSHTETSTSTSTATKTIEAEDTATGTITATSTRYISRTPYVSPSQTLQASATSMQQADSTAQVYPSRTRRPRPTNTAVPSSTPTQLPSSTLLPSNTPMPLPSDTPIPLPTVTPVPTEPPVPTDPPAPTEPPPVDTIEACEPPAEC